MLRRTTLAFLAIVALTLSFAASFLRPHRAMGEGHRRGVIRIGMVGLDTSHVIAFTRLINQAPADSPLGRARVVAGYPGGSDDFPPSFQRVERFTNQLREMGLEIVDSIAELLPRVDAVMLESVDGNQHLEQCRELFGKGKPIFIDKPLAANLKDAVEIYRLGRATSTPWFSASSSRFSPGYPDLRRDQRIGKINGVTTYSASHHAPKHRRLFFYGVHGVDLLFALMGRGVLEVQARETERYQVVTGIWSGGRVGIYRGIRPTAGRAGLGALVFGERATVYHGRGYDYRPLVEQIVRFFETGKPPVSPEECVEVMAFLEAAERSIEQDGRPVKIQDLLREAFGGDLPAEFRISESGS